VKRREFIGLVGGAAAWPVMANAQQSTRAYRIALVSPAIPTSAFGGDPLYRAFFEALGRLGYDEGRNLAVARHSGGGIVEHYAELAQEVVRAKPDVIVTATSRMVRIFKAATSTIPILAVTGDPVAYGVAASLARPGGNSTGAAVDNGPEFFQKLLELLKEAIPTLQTVGFITTPLFWGNSYGLAMRDAAQHFGIRLIHDALEKFEEADYRNAFGAMVQRRVDAILIDDQTEHYAHLRLLVELAESNRLPTIFPWLEIVEIGGLIAYAPDRKDAYRYLAACVDKVLKGADPGEIPIYQAARFNLAINLKTAKALGLVIPASLVARANEVIE
jgi:putative ABC transport system substrate-binding protein